MKEREKLKEPDANSPEEKRNRTGSENRLGTMPVGHLLIAMSVPMMISFFIQALYNIVDSMFVARISENALTAVSLAFPMQQVMNAISVGLGVGVNAGIPRFLGRGDQERADRTAGTALFLNLCFVGFFALLGLTSAREIYVKQTDIAEIIDLGSSYLSICWMFCFGCFFGQMFEKMLVCTGRSTCAMLAQAAGAIFNIVFDPLLIFGIGPFPKLGIAGAATATVSGQIFAALIAIALNVKLNSSVRIRLSFVRPDPAAVKDIFAVGFPSMVTMGLSSITTFSINQILLTYSTTATAVYGIWMKLQNFCYMPIYGMNNGMVPILSYNYAQRSRDRVTGAIRLAVTCAGLYLVALAVVLEFIPGLILAMFSASENMLSIGLRALRFFVCSLPFGGVSIILASCMQSMLHARYALTINVLRQFVFIVAAFTALSVLTHTLGMLWLAVPAAEFLTLTVAALLFRKMMKRLW